MNECGQAPTERYLQRQGWVWPADYSWPNPGQTEQNVHK